MSEFVGLAYFAEVPAVIWDIQRIGPSTGLPTRTSQGDILSAYYLSHGDTRHVLLFPADPKECFEFGCTAFDLAERLQTPGLRAERPGPGHERLDHATRFEYPEKPLDRGKVLTPSSSSELGGCLGPLQGCGRRRHPLAHAARHAASRRGLLHPRHRPHRVLPPTANGPRTGRATWSAWPASSTPRATWCRRPIVDAVAGARDRHHQPRLQRPGHRRGARPAARRPASRPATCACAPCRSTTRCATSCPSTTGSSWSRTTSTASCTRSCCRKSRCAWRRSWSSVARCNGMPLSAALDCRSRFMAKMLRRYQE